MIQFSPYAPLLAALRAKSVGLIWVVARWNSAPVLGDRFAGAQYS